MLSEIVNQILGNAGVYTVIFAIQAALYAALFAKFEASQKEGVKAAFWSTFSVLFFWESIQAAEITGMDQWPVAATLSLMGLLAFVVLGAFAYLVERPIERDLVEPGLDREVYQLPMGVPYFLSVPVANWPLAIFILLAPRSWMTGASKTVKRERPKEPSRVDLEEDLVILARLSSLATLSCVIFLIAGLLIYIASDEGAGTYEIYGGYGVSALIIAAVLWRFLPNGRKVLILNTNGFSVPSYITRNRTVIPWSNVKKIEPTRMGLSIHTHQPIGKKNPTLVPLLGNDPNEVAELMNGYIEK